MPKPDYQGGSIVNLMASLRLALGDPVNSYAPLNVLDLATLKRCRNVVLLVIDGLGDRFLNQSVAGSALRAHQRGRLTSVFPTTTTTAITTFLTGMAPQQHALTGWHTYFRELGCVLTVLPTRARFGGRPLAESGIDVARLLGHVPVFDRLDVASHIVAPQHIARSAFNLSHRGRAELHAYQTMEQMFDLAARVLRAGTGRNYVYAYWPELDRIAHEQGIGSRQSRDHLAQLDAGFADFVAQSAGSDTLVVVTADHGMIDSAQDRVIELDAHPLLRDTLALPLCGEPRVSYCYVKPDRCGDFEHYATRELGCCADLWLSRELVTAGYFGPGDPAPALYERVGHYTLIMKENFVIKDWLFGERHYTQVGVHGGLSEQELYVPLIVASC
jgi:hypothetical protein